MRFKIGDNTSILAGWAALLASLIPLTGFLYDPTQPIDTETFLKYILPILIFGMGSLYFFLKGLSAKRSQLLLGKTKMVYDPLFWRKRLIISYRQFTNVDWHYVNRGLRIIEHGIAISYHPLTPDKKIDTNQIRTLRIKGAENEKQLLLELQQRAEIPATPKSTSDITGTQETSHSLLKRLENTANEKPPPKAGRDYWLYFVAITMLGSYITLFFLEAKPIWYHAQLPESGVKTTGIVIEHRSRQRRYGRFVFITSEYDAIDSSGKTKTFTQEHICTEEQYQNFPDGAQIPIIYLAQNPEISDISGNETKLFKDNWDIDFIARLAVFTIAIQLLLYTIQSIRGYFSLREFRKKLNRR
jgi:hypothetical protein